MDINFCMNLSNSLDFIFYYDFLLILCKEITNFYVSTFDIFGFCTLGQTEQKKK